jgi:AraC-like DNA-binding protein
MSMSFLNASSNIYSAASPFEVSEYVNRNVGLHRLRLSGSTHTSASLRHRKAGALDLCRLSYGAEARVLSEGLKDIYHVQFILRGKCRYTLPRSTLDLSAGHFLMINPNEPLDLTYSEDCEKFIVKVPTAMVNEACAEHRWYAFDERIRFQQIPYRCEELSNFMMLVNLLCDEAESGQATPQILQHYNRVVTSKLMTMLRHNVDLAAPSLHSVCFERLARYIDENIKLDLSAEQLSRHSNLSLRSLYLLFEKNVRMTPKQYIRQKKLEHVHATLIDPARPAPNVTAVALEYGFTHLGRFSELYRSTYGVLPSESMRTRQRACA